MAAYKDRDMYEVITEHEVILSKALKKILNYGKVEIKASTRLSRVFKCKDM